AAGAATPCSSCWACCCSCGVGAEGPLRRSVRPRTAPGRRLAQPRPEPGGQALAVGAEPRDPLDGAWLVHPVPGREAHAGGETLALEQVDPRVVRGEPVRRPLEGLADERVAALRELRDDRVELGAEPVVGHRAAVRLELLAVHPVRADAEEQALGPDLQVLAAHRAGAAAAELQR